MSNISPVILYYNSGNGTQDDFTLADSVANYRFIEIYTCESSTYSFPFSSKFRVSDDGTVNLACVCHGFINANQSQLDVRAITYTFSETSATVQRLLNVGINASGTSVSNSPNTYIKEVVGYK